METRKIKAKVLVSLLALVGLLLQADVAALEGPVEIPPLGVSVVDSDPGGEDDKEQWGREGGRTFTFTIFQVDEYDQLKWQPIGVGIAFDGEIDAAGEILTLDFTGVGTAVWVGQTQVQVKYLNTGYYSWVTVNTEFILTVKDASDSLVSFALMDGIPTVDLKALTPNAADEVSFTATLEMRAQMPSYSSTTGICPYSSPEPTAGDFYPALNVFDCLHTNPVYVRPAITMFDAGFFYEIPSFGLAEHDAHMEALVGGVQTTVDDIYMWTDFLYTDWPGRISNIDTAHTEINDNLASMGGTLSNDLASMGGTLSNVFTTVGEINTKVDSCMQSGQEDVLNKLDDIDEGVSNLPNLSLLLLLFGIEAEEVGLPPDPDLPPFEVVKQISDLYQKLDALTGILTQLSSQGQQYADTIASLTSQLEAKNQVITNLNVVIASMYTQEELDQAIADASPGNSEYPGQGPPEKNE